MKGLLLIPKRKGGKGEEVPMDQGGYEDGLVDTASDILSAQSEGDEEGLAISLKSFVKQCLLEHEQQRDEG